MEKGKAAGGRTVPWRGVRMGVSFLKSLPWSARRNRHLLGVPPNLDVQLKESSSSQHHETVSGERVNWNATQSIHKMSEELLCVRHFVSTSNTAANNTTFTGLKRINEHMII